MKSSNFRGFSAYRLWSQLPSIELLAFYLPQRHHVAGIAIFYGVVVVGQ